MSGGGSFRTGQFTCPGSIDAGHEALQEPVPARGQPGVARRRATPGLNSSGIYRIRMRLEYPWPDWSTGRLVASLEDWFGPYLSTATGLDDVARIDLLQLLRNHLGYPAANEVEQLVPTHVDIPSGRRVAFDYSGEVPRLRPRSRSSSPPPRVRALRVS